MAAPTPPPIPGKSLLSASAAGAIVLVLTQMLSRLLTFALNQLLVRYLTPATLGVSALLDLYYMTILHFSRESLRMALQRQTDPGTSSTSTKTMPVDTQNSSKTVVAGTSAGQSQSVINLSFLAVPAGIIVAVVLQSAYILRSSSNNDISSHPYFWQSGLVFTVASIIELLSEPGFALAQQKMLYPVRASCESASVITSAVVTFVLTVYGSRKEGGLGTLPFALGQLAGSIVLLGAYLARLQRVLVMGEGFRLGLKKIVDEKSKTEYYLHMPTLNLAGTMWLQSGIKHILSHADGFLIQGFATTQDSGNYALAANYGSLIARLLFAPIEETSRNLFANLLANTYLNPPGSKEVLVEVGPTKEKLKQSQQILSLILKFYVLLSLLITSLGPSLAPLALRLVAGSRWADSPAAQTLSTYCYYIPLLALNGITEAFVQSVANPYQLKVQSGYMLGFTAAFVGAAYTFVKVLDMGAEGLVWAGCANMVGRILWSLRFIVSYYAEKGSERINWAELMPSTILMAVAVGVGGAARSVVGTGLRLGDYVKAAGLAGGVLAVMAFAEKGYFLETYRLFASARSKKA